MRFIPTLVALSPRGGSQPSWTSPSSSGLVGLRHRVETMGLGWRESVAGTGHTANGWGCLASTQRLISDQRPSSTRYADSPATSILMQGVGSCGMASNASLVIAASLLLAFFFTHPMGSFSLSTSTCWTKASICERNSGWAKIVHPWISQGAGLLLLIHRPPTRRRQDRLRCHRSGMGGVARGWCRRPANAPDGLRYRGPRNPRTGREPGRQLWTHRHASAIAVLLAISDSDWLPHWQHQTGRDWRPSQSGECPPNRLCVLKSKLRRVIGQPNSQGAHVPSSKHCAGVRTRRFPKLKSPPRRSRKCWVMMTRAPCQGKFNDS